MKLPVSLSPKIWFAVFGVALLLALGWVSTKSGPLAPIEVTVTPVVTGEVSPALFGIGTVEAGGIGLTGVDGQHLAAAAKNTVTVAHENQQPRSKENLRLPNGKLLLRLNPYMPLLELL